MWRVVLDTNVLISFALQGRGIPGRAVAEVLARHVWIGTPETMAELYAVLFAPKFDRFVSFERREEIAAFLGPFAVMRRVEDRVRVCRDPKDDKFLEAALAGRVDMIVTGDGDLLALHPFRDIEIVPPAAFLERSATL